MPASRSPEGSRARGLAALQGLDPAGPGSRSCDRLRPPWGSRPLPIPVTLRRRPVSRRPPSSGVPAHARPRSRCRGVTVCAILDPAFANTENVTSGD